MAETELEDPEDRLFRGIVKLQRPLSDASAPWLAYPSGRKPRWFIRPTAAVRRALGNDPKGYFLAQETPGGDLEIRERIKDQPW